MSHALRTLAVLLSTLLLAAAVSLGLSTLFAAPATAAPAPPTAAILPDPHFVRLQIDAITPSTVGMSSLGPLTVRGRIINDGDRDVHNLQVRLERAPAVQSSTQLRAALRASPTDVSVQSPFVTFAALLSPGQSAPFSLTLPLRGNTESTLALTQPGVYPMLVNVNGVPDYGDRARLDDAHFLLPVLTLPPDPAAAPSAQRPQQLEPTAPPALTVLWPLAERPRLLPGALGAPALLSDDELATSFADGGRLDGLLTAVEQRTRPAADPTGALAASLCLGVDPDLLVTAQAMTRGYAVAGPGGVRPGTGGRAAAAWLQRLAALAKGRCVLALPWAQADLNALARASLSTLESAAVGSDVVSKTLGVPVVPDVVWPVGSQLADRTASDLRTLGMRTVLLSSDAVATASGAALPPGIRTAQLPAGASAGAPQSLGAALLDAPLAAALGATGAGLDRTLRLQDALGALAWPAINTPGSESSNGAARTGPPPSSVVVAPPQVWTVDATEAQALLGEAGSLLRAGAATARPLPAVLGDAATTTARAVLDYPVQASADELAPATTARIARVAADVGAFGAALKQDPQSGVTPADLLAPLQLGLLRGATSGAGEATNSQVDAVHGELTQMQDSVSLQAPAGTYTLASAQSPLLLVVRNDLPVAVSVHPELDPTPGLRTTDVGVQTLPARSSRQLQVPTTVSRTGQFAIDVSLVTDTGQQLGASTRLQVRSTAYGPATALATAGAAVVLLVLVARRLWHRFRGQPDRADEGRITP